ncbi:hypothetical protein LMG22037_04667 [Paraburkholderia phenoliruptrix]|uniref:Uncharacterized protein n=1 Tax=Paraburkholderia phenoliruptrix TaxID=252970 RepID=A0A6J5BWC7_9BURK|nr:hypothetical protein [Paraburkholderia phenoliruptrix]CAB3719837.1 hypothetical protein LMG22037_04667 [Paraburkholderia phenoliruptrix]
MMNFLRGFLSGLAGPVSLFSEPRRVQPVKIEIKKLHRSIADPVEAMRADWQQVGDDLRAVMGSKIGENE